MNLLLDTNLLLIYNRSYFLSLLCTCDPAPNA